MIRGICAVSLATQAFGWDAANKTADAIISPDGATLTANAAGSNTYARARSVMRLVGKCYFSALLVTPSGHPPTIQLGVLDSGEALADTTWAGQAATSIGGRCTNSTGQVWTNAALRYGVGFNGTTPLEVAVDVATRRVWMRNAGAGWPSGGDPETGAFPSATLSGTGDLYICADILRASSVGRSVLLHTTAGVTSGTPPAGYTIANWEIP